MTLLSPAIFRVKLSPSSVSDHCAVVVNNLPAPLGPQLYAMVLTTVRLIQLSECLCIQGIWCIPKMPCRRWFLVLLYDVPFRWNTVGNLVS